MTPKPDSYLLCVAIALDQLVNAIRGGNPDETMSSRAHAKALQGYPAEEHVINALAYAITWLFTLGRNPQTDHCAKSYERKHGCKALTTTDA